MCRPNPYIKAPSGVIKGKTYQSGRLPKYAEILSLSQDFKRKQFYLEYTVTLNNVVCSVIRTTLFFIHTKTRHIPITERYARNYKPNRRGTINLVEYPEAPIIPPVVLAPQQDTQCSEQDILSAPVPSNSIFLDE